MPPQVLVPSKGVRGKLLRGFFRYLVIYRSLGLYYGDVLNRHQPEFFVLQDKTTINKEKQITYLGRLARVYWNIIGPYEVLKRVSWFGLTSIFLVP